MIKGDDLIKTEIALEELGIKKRIKRLEKKSSGFRVINNQGGGGGTTDLYTNATPTPTDIGGVEVGSTFDHVSMSDMWTDLLYPILYPTLTAPSSTFVLTEAGTYESGDTIATLHFLSSFSRGSINPAYGTSGFRSGLPNEYNYTGTGLSTHADTDLTDALTVDDYDVVAGTQSWTNSVDYDAGEQPKDSEGNNYDTPLSAGTTSTDTVTITGIYPYLYGVDDPSKPASEMYADFTHSVTVKGNKTIEFTTTANVPYFCYPASYGDLTSIKDINNFEVLPDWTKSVANITGLDGLPVSYNIYSFNNISTTTMTYQFTY